MMSSQNHYSLIRQSESISTMVKLKHGAHECVLTSPEIIANGICNICFKDEPIEFACDLCNFDLCRACSKLPLKVSHDFHPDHPLEFCLGKKDGNERYKLCSGCGDLFSDQSLYYKCKDCEIFLDLGCAILNNIKTGWYAEEKLHYSHAHLLRRCKSGPDARGSCLICELPLTPSAISYGCFQCYLFVHERCLHDLPREIQHPVHQAHPLTRLDFTHTCGGGKVCDACGVHISGAPLSCIKCNFHLHMRCADSLLRGLVNKSHHHKLFYLANNAELRFRKGCRVCMRDNHRDVGDRFYNCVECGWRSHFKCLGIPESVVKKSYHIHPLVCHIFFPDDDDSLEYCGVCETMVHAGHHAYCCLECGFVSHIECILHEEVPSPLYLKDLYSDGEKLITRPPADHDDDCETKELENKLVVTDITHNHVLSSRYVTSSHKACWICFRYIHGRLWKCETCRFEAHDNCVKLSQQSRYRFHLNHPLTLLPSYPAGVINMRCNTCKEKIESFNLFCRICDFVICTECAVSLKMRLGELQRGQKFIRYEQGKLCLQGGHDLVQVMVSSSYMVGCTICDDKLCGNIVSCPDCEEIYHPRCIELWRRYRAVENHPFHYHHTLYMIKRKTGSKCTACKQDIDISKYVLFCSTCFLSFHFKCIETVGISTRIKSHKHCLYIFVSDCSSRPCTICNKPCGASFYACNICDVCAHEECIGFPTYVKNQRHQHVVNLNRIYATKNCSICGLDTKFLGHKYQYTCDDCKGVFHTKCIMSMVGEASTEEKQISDHSNLIKDMDDSDEEDSDSS